MERCESFRVMTVFQPNCLLTSTFSTLSKRSLSFSSMSSPMSIGIYDLSLSISIFKFVEVIFGWILVIF